MNSKVTVTTSASGIGLSGLLTIVFIILKLCNVINWSWLWVLSPLWIGFIVFLVVLDIIAIVWLIMLFKS
jgi:hypothetical protein